MQEVAVATLSCLRRHVPAAVPGPKPWKVSFSYGRALQDPALEARRGRGANLTAGKSALAHRARCYGAASLGGYSVEMEASPADADSPEHRREWRDD